MGIGVNEACLEYLLSHALDKFASHLDKFSNGEKRKQLAYIGYSKTLPFHFLHIGYLKSIKKVHRKNALDAVVRSKK